MAMHSPDWGWEDETDVDDNSTVIPPRCGVDPWEEHPIAHVIGEVGV